MGRFRFGEFSQRVIQGYFHSIEGAEAVRTSGHHSDFVIQTLDGAAGNLALGLEPVQEQRFVRAQHPGDLLHRLESAAHGQRAPVIQKGSGPDIGFVVPEVLEGFLESPGPSGRQFAGH